MPESLPRRRRRCRARLLSRARSGSFPPPAPRRSRPWPRRAARDSGTGCRLRARILPDLVSGLPRRLPGQRAICAQDLLTSEGTRAPRSRSPARPLPPGHRAVPQGGCRLRVPSSHPAGGDQGLARQAAGCSPGPRLAGSSDGLAAGAPGAAAGQFATSVRRSRSGLSGASGWSGACAWPGRSSDPGTAGSLRCAPCHTAAIVGQVSGSGHNGWPAGVGCCGGRCVQDSVGWWRLRSEPAAGGARVTGEELLRPRSPERAAIGVRRGGPTTVNDWRGWVNGARPLGGARGSGRRPARVDRVASGGRGRQGGRRCGALRPLCNGRGSL